MVIGSTGAICFILSCFLNVRAKKVYYCWSLFELSSTIIQLIVILYPIIKTSFIWICTKQRVVGDKIRFRLARRIRFGNRHATCTL